MSDRFSLSRWAARQGMLLLLLVLSMATPPPVNAQEVQRGTLEGLILDAQTEKPLPFANVVFIRVTKDNPDGEPAGGAMGTAEGTFSGKVPPGTYNLLFSYISYKTTTVSGVFVAPGRTVTVDGRLEPDAIVVEKVQVTAEAIRNAEGSMLAQLKKSAAVSDAITSELISKSGDSDAAEAAERVTGISVVDGKYVFVRGLGERYSSTQVNGSAVGTPETNKRVVPLDLFPASVVDNIVIQKTYTPDMEGDFGGGVVSINTRDFIEGSSFKQSLSLGQTTGGAAEFLSYRGGSRDFLGFDDGTRALPGEIAAISKRIDRFSHTADERAGFTKLFENVWSPRAASVGPNFGYSGVYARGFTLFGREAGWLSSLSLSNSFKSVERAEYDYVGDTPATLYDVVQSTGEVLGGVTSNLSLRLREEGPDRIKLNVLYTRSADDLVKVSEGYNDDFGTDARRTELVYVERGVSQGVLQGKHTLGLFDSEFDWNLGYSEASRNEPDRRQSTYELSPVDSTWTITGRSGYGLQRFFGEGAEYARTAKLDWTLPWRLPGRDTDARLKLGYARSSKNRDSQFRRFLFSCVGAGCQGDKTLPPEDLVVDSEGNVDYVLEERTLPFDTFSANHRVNAAYAMLDLPVLPWIRAVAGARYEDSRQTLQATSPFATQSGVSAQESRNIDTDWLPSVNLTLTPGPRTNMRLAYARTVNRPELRELTPSFFYNYERGWEETGNPDLRSARIRNYDARIEYYAAPGEFLGFALFRKEFDEPIQKFVKGLASGYAEEPRNGIEGMLQGFEAEARVSATTIWKALDWLVDLETEELPGALSDWGLLTNFSRIESEVTLDLAEQGDTLDRSTTKPFSGQSEYSLNAGVFYRRPRVDAALLYKAFGDRMVLFSEVARFKDLTEEPASGLDFNLGYQLSNSARLKFGASNLLDEDTVYRLEDGKVTRRFRNGRSFGFSISYEPAPSREE